MKKKGVTIKISNRGVYGIVTLVVLLLIGGIVYATNSANPAIMGHTADEIEGGAGGSSDTQIQSGTIVSGTSSYTSEVSFVPKMTGDYIVTAAFTYATTAYDVRVTANISSKTGSSGYSQFMLMPYGGYGEGSDAVVFWSSASNFKKISLTKDVPVYFKLDSNTKSVSLSNVNFMITSI